MSSFSNSLSDALEKGFTSGNIGYCTEEINKIRLISKDDYLPDELKFIFNEFNRLTKLDDFDFDNAKRFLERNNYMRDVWDMIEHAGTDDFMPVRGYGATKANHIAAALNYIVYRYYNDGDEVNGADHSNVSDRFDKDADWLDENFDSSFKETLENASGTNDYVNELNYFISCFSQDLIENMTILE